MIPFIRVFPNGANKLQEIERSPEIEKLAALFIEREGRFLIRIDDKGRVNLAAAIMDEGEPWDAALADCDNGPEMLDAIDKMVHEAVENQTKFLKGAKPPFVPGVSVERH